MQSTADEISSLLHAWCGGDRTALDKLMPLVYEELHRLAHSYMRQERGNQTLQTTALVNEAFLRLVKAREIEWKDRNHFYAISANLMRRILVDLARSRGYQKRGGKVKRISLNTFSTIPIDRDPDLIRIDEALDALAGFDSRKAKVVELRFFGGLSVRETAEVLEVSTSTVDRDWEIARTWLYRELKNRN
ncbi:MAG: sigma-70 family RNA polymerase sigma factor [Acidobacteria bacterium]|nr:sigma-70 family RNA polymerase sigma factor [Acidobacteriota bacterium]